MGAWSSKPSICAASSSVTEPWSLPTASVPPKDPRDGERRSAGALACIPPSKAMGLLKRRWCSALPEDDGNTKRIKDAGKAVGDALHLSHDGRCQQEPESQLFSCPPTGSRSDLALGPSGSAPSVHQPLRSFKLDASKHKIFLSHSGAQKDFVEQLCVDLERVGYFFPFFDEREHSLPRGEDFAPLILEAARSCHVAVVVLSEEFMRSKWPMMELAAFYAARRDASDGVVKPKLLPLFFKLSVEEVKDEGQWMRVWNEHAARDSRIDLTVWSAAVKALCRANGLNFEKYARKEVPYRKGVVESVVKLSPPDVLFGVSESMVGCDRMCEAMSRQFVEDPIIGAEVLGVYGVAGMGKTMLAKAMCDFFYGEFFGKVFYVDMSLGSRFRRQKRMLKKLCGFEKDAVGFIDLDGGKGLTQMKAYMNQERMFLVLDNVTNNGHLLEEVQEYLRLGFHSQSRVMVMSSSKAILEELIPKSKVYMPMPKLMDDEAKRLFLKHVAPMKALCELTSKEQNILEFCVQKCCFWFDDGYFYHPLALKALADFFLRLGEVGENSILGLEAFLDVNMDGVKDAFKSSKDLFRILGLQFSTFSFLEKLLFLDLALFGRLWLDDNHVEDDFCFNWLCRLHNESPPIIKMRLLDLRKSGLIEFNPRRKGYGLDDPIQVPDSYEKFAEWYASDYNMNGMKNAFGVFEHGGVNLTSDSSTPLKCWSNLIRLRIDNMTLSDARFFVKKGLHELNNLVVLHLKDIGNLTTLNLEGLHCLQKLELIRLEDLATISLGGNPSQSEYVGIFDSLQYVHLERLPSLLLLPDLRLCTSLYIVVVRECEEVKNMEVTDCPYLKVLVFLYLKPYQLLTLHSFPHLDSLKILCLGDHAGFFGEWICNGDESYEKNKAFFEDEGPYPQIVEHLYPLLKSRDMICTEFYYF